MQFRRLTRDTAGRRSSAAQSRIAATASILDHLHPANARSRSQRCLDAGGTVWCQEPQEGGGFSAEAPPWSSG